MLFCVDKSTIGRKLSEHKLSSIPDADWFQQVGALRVGTRQDFRKIDSQKQSSQTDSQLVFYFLYRLVGFCTVVSSFLFFLHLMLKLLFLFFSSGCLHITFFCTFSVSSVSIIYCYEAKQPQAPKIGRIQWDSYFAPHGVSLSDSLKLCWSGLTRAVQGWKGLRMPQSVSASWYSSTWPLFRV